MTGPSRSLVAGLTLLLAAPGASAGQEVLALGTTLQGRLAAGDTTDAGGGEIARLIPLDVPPGTLLVVTLESGDFDAYAGIVRTSGDYFYFLSENDDAPGLTGPGDARTRYVPEEGVSYAVFVGSYDGTGTGAFTLSAAEAAPGERYPRPLGTGRWVEGALDGADWRGEDGDLREVWAFESEAKDRVLILARGEASPEVVVRSAADGTVLARERVRNGLSFVDWFDEEGGMREVEVRSRTGREGPYALRVWKPAPTHAEMAGLEVGPDEVRHERYGFSFPSPGPRFMATRGLARPHNQYGDGYSRVWYLVDREEEGAVAILFGGTYGPLSDQTFQELSSGFLQGFAQALGGGDSGFRTKRDGPRSVRGTAPGGAQSLQGRCIGTPAEVEDGRTVCVAILSEGPDAAVAKILDGMVLR